MRYLAAMTMTFALAATTARAGERLTEIENAYVDATAATAMMVIRCDATTVKDGVPELADRLGVDAEIQAATRAAFAAYAGIPYERRNLIPSVTQDFRATAAGIDDEFSRNKKKTCAKWIDALRKVGTIE